MTLDEARIVLDRVRNGLWESDRQIKEALFVSGDLSKDRGTLRSNGHESCFSRSRKIYGEAAYERVFGIVQESGPRCKGED